MSIPGSAEPLLLAQQDTGYRVERSLRFNSSDSAFCSRSVTAGNQKTWSLSFWLKRAALGTDQEIFATANGDLVGFVRLTSGNLIRVFSRNASAVTQYDVSTVAVLRDCSAWYHILVVQDTTQATSGDRIKIYINGTLQTLTTATAASLNADCAINSTNTHNIGNQPGASVYLSAYLADVVFADGQALTPSSLTEVSATTGQLIPKAYTGTYGTNGFRLDFSNPLDLGNDAAGTNDWTPNNLSGVSGGPTSVAAASGALPIYNTTDTYGATKGTGTRTDSSSSSIVLAIPMDGANNGTTFTDESATIKGSGSAKTITRFNTTTVTAQSKFYGSSGSYDGSTKYLRLDSSADFDFGSGAFTVEAWVYLNALPTTDSWPGSFANWMNIAAYGTASVADGWQFRIGQTILAFGTNSDSTAVSATHGIGTGKWNHLAATRNGNVYTLWVNGVSIGSATYTANNPGTGAYLWVGTETAQGAWLNGYLQDLRVYKGVAKYTSNFNPPSSTQNATVAAGNDSLVDTPTSYGTGTSGGDVRGNFCTWNPLTGNTYSASYKNGNLDFDSSVGADGLHVFSTFQLPSTGKWYWETVYSQGSGFVGINSNATLGNNTQLSTMKTYYYNGDIGGTGGNATWGVGDVIGAAYDADAGTLKFYKNGTLQATTISSVSFSNGPWWAQLRQDNNCISSTNFGQRPFAYPVSGFKALCDTNLPAPVVAKSSDYFQTVLYTGNGSTQTVSGLSFSPDLVWVKGRNAGWWHTLTDTVRGGSAWLHSNVTNAEATNGLITGFTSDGFTLSASPNGTVNQNNDTYVAWAWDAGSSTVTNTQGSITSSVRANPSAGFSIVTFTGPVSPSTVGHGLGVAPSMIILKNRDQGGAGYRWCVYHQSIGNTKALFLDGTNAESTNSAYWNNTTPTSTVFSVGGAIITGAEKMVAYCFAPVAGYSSFGSYTGNGSTDGPFIYTGFRPRWIMFKATYLGGSTDWTIWDTARDPFNVVSNFLRPNLSVAEQAISYGDILSNGFKFRFTDGNNNQNGSTYIYAAFAESPFQYARAR